MWRDVLEWRAEIAPRHLLARRWPRRGAPGMNDAIGLAVLGVLITPFALAVWLSVSLGVWLLLFIADKIRSK
jgi:hypothetical protein